MQMVPTTGIERHDAVPDSELQLQQTQVSTGSASATGLSIADYQAQIVALRSQQTVSHYKVRQVMLHSSIGMQTDEEDDTEDDPPPGGGKTTGSGNGTAADTQPLPTQRRKHYPSKSP